MKAKRTYGFFLLVLLLSMGSAAAAQPNKVIIGYVGGYRGLIKPGMVDPKKITHLNYAFVNVIGNRAVLSREKTDTVNLRNLVLLKKLNPHLKILISIGGWTWSGGFSDAALTDTSRQAFAASAIAIVKRFNLDGVDIDWEYPDQAGNGNINRKEDKQNYTLMFGELRKQLTELGSDLHQSMLLTTAAGGFANFLKHTEMDKAAAYLDYINLMTYDYFGNGSAVHHSNLYASKTYTGRDNAADAVKAYLAAGIPASKLVLGVAFYGRVFQLADTAKKGLGDISLKHLRQLGYDMIRDSLLTDKALGFAAYRDTVAMAPYLFSNTNHQFVTYDDLWSIDNKCKYGMEHQMAGVMFWEYDSDPKSYLLDEVNKDLNNHQ